MWYGCFEDAQRFKTIQSIIPTSNQVLQRMFSVSFIAFPKPEIERKYMVGL